MKIKDCMESNVYYLKPENTIQDCAQMMSSNHIGCVPICDDNKKIVGLVTDRDIILRSIAWDKNIKTTPLSEIMSTNVCCCNSNFEISEAQEIMRKNQIRRLPIVNDNKEIIGIITLGDLAKNNNTNNNEVYYLFETICKCNDKNAE